jgi:hypothetical protein
MNMRKKAISQAASLMGKRSYAARLDRLGIQRIREIARKNGKKGGRPRNEPYSGTRRCANKQRGDAIAQRRCNVAAQSITRTALYARISTSNNGQAFLNSFDI